jgi:multidrug resistance efflux pump
VIASGAVLFVASAAVFTHLFTTRSRDAVVEADVIDLATPIAGVLETLSVDVGTSVGAGQTLGVVESSRADASDMERLSTALNTSESDLQRTDRELELLNQQLKDYARDAADQRRFELERLNNQLAAVSAELSREQQEVSYSERDLKRQEELFRAGAVAERVVDRARTSLAQNKQQLAGIQARIGAVTSQKQAAERDLSLDRTRGNIDPTPRLQETKLRQQLLTSQRLTQQKRVSGLESELRNAKQLLQKRREAVIKAPRAGVIWRLLARSGDDLKAQQKVIRMVDCKRRWLITTVSESTLSRLKIGSPASIDLAGEALNLNGRVDLIRSGIDRLSGDVNDNPKPLLQNQKALSQVRVQILNDVPAPAAKLCFVGYGAKVIFR